ncbi:GSCFA domain-containing protein [Brevibacterium sp. CFH 10365]|uniref:GSCFA domain-containing protein n=1 Tax=Brevibacterium sp. CFH 10365 TaxID=2585207 RepID=UPI001D0D6B51|nr:GSCFA domain-containing protein [Brevibacterium sp. CFH 10365]
MHHPYRGLEERAFWRASVGSRHFADIVNLWDPLPIGLEDEVATAGSCFAQHIGRNLQARGASYMDVEAAPVAFSDADEARRWGFGVFSARYGNIYTSRQLLQLFMEAHGERRPDEVVWEKDGRFYDALRPSVDPIGQESADDVIELRRAHLAAVRKMFRELDVFVFTLGLTEGWEAVSDGTMYPVAPGTAAGQYDRRKYRFRNLRYSQVMQDLREFWRMLKEVNPGARMLLTVSPVPLAATASGEHVLVATTYSKSVLRAVAGDLTTEEEDIYYFPSYEIITAPATHGVFYDPDLRNVNQFGVDVVMDHFFSGPIGEVFGDTTPVADDGELICDEGKLDTSQAV